MKLPLAYLLLTVLQNGSTSVEANLRARSTSDIFNQISNYAIDTRVGNSIMGIGDSVVLSRGEFECLSDGSNCAAADTMFALKDLTGTIDCIDHSDICEIRGGNRRRHMLISGTADGRLLLKAIIFSNGAADYGGSLRIESSYSSNPRVDIQLSTFRSNEATGSGGGAIYVDKGAVNIQASVFRDNTAPFGDGADVYGRMDVTVSVEVSSTCPAPYDDNVPEKGQAMLTNEGAVKGDLLSHSGCTPDDICLNNARRRLALPVAGGVYLLKELGGALFEDFIVPAAISEAENYFFGGDDKDAAPSGTDCVDYPHSQVTFCSKGDVQLDHPVTRRIVGEAIARDAKAARSYSDLESASEFEDMLTGGKETCKKVTKMSLCLDAFPVCECEVTKSPCLTACELVNTCAVDYGKPEKPCHSCDNFCEKVCAATKLKDTIIAGASLGRQVHIVAAGAGIGAASFLLF